LFVAGITGHFLDLEKENPRYVGPARTWRGFYVCLTANPARSKRLAGPGNALCSLAGRYLWWRDAPIRGAGGDYGSSDHSTGGWGEYWHLVPVRMVSFRWCPRLGKAVVIFLMSSRMRLLTALRIRSMALDALRGLPPRPVSAFSAGAAFA